MKRCRIYSPVGTWLIQCTYFEKSVSRNWAVPPHQDLSIPVARRLEEAQLGGWSRKEGSVFVQPPVGLLEQLVAVRLHLEACTRADGPLQVLPGSHRSGAWQTLKRRHCGARQRRSFALPKQVKLWPCAPCWSTHPPRHRATAGAACCMSCSARASLGTACGGYMPSDQNHLCHANCARRCLSG